MRSATLAALELAILSATLTAPMLSVLSALKLALLPPLVGDSVGAEDGDPVSDSGGAEVSRSVDAEVGADAAAEDGYTVALTLVPLSTSLDVAEDVYSVSAEVGVLPPLMLATRSALDVDDPCRQL